MSQLKLLSALATVAIAGFAAPAVAQEAPAQPSQISTSVGFTLSNSGAVTSLTLSTAVSDTYTFSSAASNNGGVYTESFASSEVLTTITNAGMPANINEGNAIVGAGEFEGPSTILIQAPGPVNIRVEETDFFFEDISL